MTYEGTKGPRTPAAVDISLEAMTSELGDRHATLPALMAKRGASATPEISSAEDSTPPLLPRSRGESSILHSLVASQTTTLVAQFDSFPRTYSTKDGGVQLHVRSGSLKHGQLAGPITIEETRLLIECGGSWFLALAVVDCQPTGRTFDTPLDLDFRVEVDLGEQDDDSEDANLDERLDRCKEIIWDTYKVKLGTFFV